MVGDIVLFVLDEGRNVGEVRPAIITQEFDNAVHLTIFTAPGDFNKLPAGGAVTRLFVQQDTAGRQRGSYHRRFKSKKKEEELVFQT